MATCPKCRSTDLHSDRMHKAAHGLHTSPHPMEHVSPMARSGAMIVSGFALLGLCSARHCQQCKHVF